jgi:hypothetical protein
MKEEKKEKYGDFSSLEISKDKLIDILNANLEKHNIIYNAAVSGYYDVIDGCYKKWNEQIEECILKLENFSNLLESGVQNKIYGKEIIKKPDVPYYNTRYDFPSFPVSHEDEYKSAIKRVELSIRNVFSLNDEEFKKYILNDWTWKKDFMQSSFNYVNCVTGGLYYTPAVSGCFTTF